MNRPSKRELDLLIWCITLKGIGAEAVVEIDENHTYESMPVKWTINFIFYIYIFKYNAA